MKRAVRQILICAAVLTALCILSRVLFHRNYESVMPIPYPYRLEVEPADLRLEFEEEGIVSVERVEKRDDALFITVKPEGRGETFMDVYDKDNNLIGMQKFRVSPLNTIYDGTSGGFSGDNAVMAANALFCFAISAIMLWNFFKARGSEFYSYTTIYFAGFSIFSFSTGALLAIVCARHLLEPAEFMMESAYSIICGASSQFMLLTTPLIIVFASALAVSNIALLRHDRPGLKNLLGLILSLVMLAGDALGLFILSQNISGSHEEFRFISMLQNMYATVYVYFECMLAGSVICALKATRLTPGKDKSFIIILGCAFRRDGSLPPLLRGRVDRALSFWKWQKAARGKEAVFIPSGGRGADEAMSEAEAMKRYLVANGVSEDMIIEEDKSADTYQNMLFSKRIIDSSGQNAGTVFATTNYHLFRSGVWANRAGLSAEGIGSKTKWWYWPNAFVRECLGLLKHQWKEELALLLSMVAFFAVMSFVML